MSFLRVILWIFAIIGVVTTLIVGTVIGAVAHFRPKAPQVAEATVLTVDLTWPVTEKPQQSIVDQLTDQKTTNLPVLLSALERATDDPRVKGLVAHGGESGLGLAQSQELRDAIKRFRAKGKFAYVFGDSFGDLGAGTKPYFLAAGFDEIWLQPGGVLALTGIGADIPFFKGALDKLGVVPEFERRGEFKTAATQFTETKLPDTDRAAMTDLIGNLYGQLVGGIAEGRKLDPAAARSIIEAGPYNADAALKAHLVDHLGYLDQVEDAARAKAGPGAKMTGAKSYLAAMKASDGAGALGDGLGVIRAIGTIVGGEQEDSPFGSSALVGADTIARAFDEARADPHVKAVVLRIDSPGGSEGASETIWRAVARTRAAGKPVIVSMSDLAASGGYYIAAGADKIVAEPATETGSIGVFGGKFALGGLMEKLGISHDQVGSGPNAFVANEFDTFTPDQRKRFATFIDDAYRQFLERVSAGRHLDVAQVDAIARGRVWTGAEARERGLVDELGGFDRAVALAKDAAHLPVGQFAPLREFPTPRNGFEAFVQQLGSDSPLSRGIMVLSRLSAFEPLTRDLGMIEAQPGDVVMRPVEIGR